MAQRADKSKMACNKPQRTSGASKKFVVKACDTEPPNKMSARYWSCRKW